MTIETIRQRLPDFARDLRLNLGSVLTPEGAPGLTAAQIALIATASSIATRQPALAAAVRETFSMTLSAEALTAAQTAAALMGMNNIYYRFTHLVRSDNYRQLPARLRMNAIANPGIPKVDFELAALAVSAINGCGACLDAHEHMVREAGISAEGVQSAVRIAAVLNGTAIALDATADAAALRAA